MNQIAAVPRCIIVFSAQKDGNIIDLKFQSNGPAEMTIPLPGDEVRLPIKVAKEAGFDRNVFTVKIRRFRYDDIPVGIAGVVSLIVSQEP